MSKATKTNIAATRAAGISDEQLVSLGLQKIAEHGLPPGDKNTAAYHEAGHLVFGIACQGIGAFKECHLYMSPTTARWEGFSSVAVSSTHFAPVFELERAMEQAGRSLAGVVGEQIADRYHPASSIEEVMTTNAICGQIVLHEDYAKLVVTTGTTVVNAISDNRKLFDACAERLIAKGRITKGWLRKRRVKSVDWAPALEVARSEQVRLGTHKRFEVLGGCYAN